MGFGNDVSESDGVRENEMHRLRGVARDQY